MIRTGRTRRRLGRPAVEFLGQRQRLIAHRDPVLDRLADVGENRFDLALKVADSRGSRHPVDLEVHQRLVRAVVRHVLDPDDVAVLVALDMSHRMRQQVDLQVELFEEGEDRVDDEGHVLTHHIDHRMWTRPAVDLGAWVVHTHQRLGRLAGVGHLEVAHRRGVQLERLLVGKVVGGNPAVVQAHHPTALRRVITAVAPLRQIDHGIDQGTLDLCGRVRHRFPSPPGRFRA
ncbi:MAG: hypothetical protein R2710_00830 [Acidimicrobiales bacterium]